ncbi:Guanylate cyclase, partial [Meloidogyne graminicola]
MFLEGFFAIFLLLGNVKLEIVEDSTTTTTTTRSTTITLHQIKNVTVGTGQLMSGQKGNNNLTSLSTTRSLALMNSPNFSGIKVRIGHIGAINVMPKAEQILEVCRKELWKEGVLNEDFDIEIISQMGCGESFEGVAVGADMYHQQNVKAFIGPYCNAEMDAVSKMAAFWNVPIIGYMAASNVFSDKTIYKTLARVSLRTTNSLALATYSLIRHYGWNRVAIATNTGPMAFERAQAFEEIFHSRKITVVKKLMFEENVDAKGMMASGYLEDLKNSARIVICLFSSTREMTKEFMQAISQSGLKTHEFVYILPWLQAEAKDASPWIGNDGQMIQNIKEFFTGSIIIDDVNGFDNTILTPFKERVESNGMSVEDLNLQNIYGYIHLYDALKLYSLAARIALNETGGNPNVTTDGRYLWNKMRRMAFPGLVNAEGLVSAEGVSSGQVFMDDLAERAAIYAAFYVAPNRDDVMKMVEMNPIPTPNCDGIINKSGCFELKITDLLTGFWPSTDGHLPSDEPACGFRNERCDYTLMIVIGILALVALLGIGAGFIFFRILENRALSRTSWRIFRDDMRIVSVEEMKSMLSIGSSKTKLSNMARFAKHHAVIGTNTHASFHLYPQRRPISFIRTDLQLLSLMKMLVHDNLNPFMGIAFNEKDELLVLWKFCSRGTIQDIVYNESVTLDNKFHAAFVRDITLGLEYLHMSPIGYHGSLTPWACLIDRNWMVKLTDFAIANCIERWEKQGYITKETLKDGEDKSGATQLTNVLYCAPELLKNREQNRRRGMEQGWLKQSQARRQAGDIYSFGIVMYEILFRSLPFPEGTDLTELCEYVRDGSKTFKPVIADRSQVHPDIISLLQDCWASNPEIRPSIRRVRLNTENYLKVKGSLVDQMMRMMEQYANNLEKLVQERTGMLEDANKRADKLLNQLLPSYVANELKLGRSVAPKTFKSASVMFSDIVGFTTICSTSSPLEVVTMLNTVYTGFDDLINKHEAYKVETIGDAYMVASGIPQEIGVRHLMHLSDVALEIMAFLKNYEIPHMKPQKIRIRIGLHTGPVAAGVVGLTTPRYCLFGDTVNMASPNGLPERIQISEAYKEALQKHYPEFRVLPRGKIEVKGKGTSNLKGKGEVVTYWLNGKIGQEEQPYAPSPELLSQVKVISAGGPIITTTNTEQQINLTVEIKI